MRGKYKDFFSNTNKKFKQISFKFTKIAVFIPNITIIRLNCAYFYQKSFFVYTKMCNLATPITNIVFWNL